VFIFMLLLILLFFFFLSSLSFLFFFFFFHDTATPEIYTLSLHDALPICPWKRKFLGFSFTSNKKQPKIRLAKQSVERFKARIRKLTSRKQRIAMEQRIAKLNSYDASIVSWTPFSEI